MAEEVPDPDFRRASVAEARAEIGKPFRHRVIEAELAKTKVLINASAVSDAETMTPIPGELLAPDLLVLDLMFVPRDTKLLRDARAAGARRVQAITSPDNRVSVEFHRHLGFRPDDGPGSSPIYGVAAYRDFDGEDQDRAVLIRTLSDQSG